MTRSSFSVAAAGQALMLLFASGCRQGNEGSAAGPAPAPASAPAQPTPAPPPAPATEPKPAEAPVSEAELGNLLAGWQTAQAKSKTVVCKFSCSETLAMLAKPRTTSGRIELSRPGSYRRTVLDAKTGAVRGVMILKPPDLWVYVPDLKTAEHYDLSRAAAGGGVDPGKLLEDAISFDAERLRKRFKLGAVREGALVRLEFAPLDGKAVAGIEKLRLWLKPGAAFPEKMETATTGGDVRLETYSDVNFGEKLDAALFTFKPPPGVKMTEVVK